MKGPLIVGLTESPDRLVNLRRTRLKTDENENYYNKEMVKGSVTAD